MHHKKVLIFSTAYLPHIGGAEVAVKEITDRLPDISFVLLTARLNKDLPVQEKIGNVEVYRIGSGSAFDKIRLIFQGPGFAKKLGKFDLVWSIMASYAGFASLFYKNKNKKTPFLLTLQEGDDRAHIYKRVWFVWPLFKRIFTRADYIQAISNYLADWAKKMGAKCTVEVVPNGVNVQSLESKNKSNDVKRIISVSRLVKKNGLEHLIKAVKIVNNNYDQPVVLKIIGDGELKKDLKNLSKSLGLYDRFVILEGSIPNEQVYGRLRQSDVFVRPSLSEGLGNAFLEAMAAGLPVIGTKVGGIPDFLEDGVTGWYAQVNNPKSIAEKIKYVLAEENKEEVEEVKNNALHMVKEKYNWDLIAEKMQEVFNKV